MAPSAGLTITKLGFYGTTDWETGTVKGLLCLKLSLPREIDGRNARWALFNGQIPRVRSTPTIHPLPLSRSAFVKASSTAKHLKLATSLLGLPSPLTYPPTSPLRNEAKPSPDVSSTTGQVYVVLEGPKAKGRKEPSAGAKRDWVMVIELETDIDQSQPGVSKIDLGLPKCLDNVVQVKVSPPLASSSASVLGSIDLVTSPKILPLPETFFQPLEKGVHADSGGLGPDAWEDGEVFGPDDRATSEDWESDDDDAGTWLRGRFQSTDTLHLSWAYASSTPRLTITPAWHPQQPTISISYETLIDVEDALSVGIDLPSGWGWRDLDISADGLTSWHSTDVPFWSSASSTHDYEDDSFDHDHEDSFATVRAKSKNQTRPSIRPMQMPSLMQQTLPSSEMSLDDFSFEEPRDDHLRSSNTSLRPMTPSTPGHRRSPSPAPVASSEPLPGSAFDLQFAPLGPNDSPERRILIQGSAVPLHLTLVPASLPCVVPLVHLSHPSASNQCQLTINSSGQNVDAASRTLDVTGLPRSTFQWRDSTDAVSPLPPLLSSQGTVSARIRRAEWGDLECSIQLPVAARSGEFGFSLAGLDDNSEVKVTRAVIAGRAIPRCALKVDNAWEVRMARGDAGTGTTADVVLHVTRPGGVIPVPLVSNMTGTLKVELEGNNWGDVIKTKTNMTRISTTSYCTSLPSREGKKAPYITLSAGHLGGLPSRTKTSFSVSTFINLFFLYLLLSMGQQVQRLRTEVSFLADEARDLRMHAMDLQQQHQKQQQQPVSAHGPPSDIQGIPSPAGPGGEEGEKDMVRRQESTTALARVVFRSAWGEWTSHPTVRTVARGLGWLWHAVVWIVHG